MSASMHRRRVYDQVDNNWKADGATGGLDFAGWKKVAVRKGGSSLFGLSLRGFCNSSLVSSFQERRGWFVNLTFPGYGFLASTAWRVGGVSLFSSSLLLLAVPLDVASLYYASCAKNVT